MSDTRKITVLVQEIITREIDVEIPRDTRGAYSAAIDQVRKDYFYKRTKCLAEGAQPYRISARDGETGYETDWQEF